MTTIVATQRDATQESNHQMNFGHLLLYYHHYHWLLSCIVAAAAVVAHLLHTKPPHVTTATLLPAATKTRCMTIASTASTASPVERQDQVPAIETTKLKSWETQHVYTTIHMLSTDSESSIPLPKQAWLHRQSIQKSIHLSMSNTCFYFHACDPENLQDNRP